MHGGGQWIHDGVARVTHGRRVIAVSGPETAPHADGHVRVLCAHNPRIWKTSRHAGYRPRPGRASAWLPAGRLRVSGPAVSGRALLPVLLPESSTWFDTAGGQPRGQRSPADPLAVSSRSGAVPCLTGAGLRRQSERPGRCGPASCRSDVFCAVCRCSFARHPGRRCESWASSRSTPFMCFAIRSHCRARESASWRCSWILQGCTNAAWDHKDLCEAEYQAIRQRLEQAGLGSCIEEYLGRLRRTGEPAPVNRWRSSAFRRSSLVPRGGRAAVAGHGCRDRARTPSVATTDIRAAHCDSDVDTLFRILMQCQIIDDVLDYAEDVSAGLPSFLTQSASLPQAMELTATSGTLLCREPRAFIRHRRVSAAHGAVRRHGGDDSSSFVLPIGGTETRDNSRTRRSLARGLDSQNLHPLSQVFRVKTVPASAGRYQACDLARRSGRV